MTLSDTAKAFTIKYAQPGPEDRAESLKKFKAKIAPWLSGSYKILANIGSELTPEVVNDPKHLYNVYDQSSGNIAETYAKVKKLMGSIYSNYQRENYKIETMDQVLNQLQAVIAANPQYKTNPLFKLKKNTQYSFDDCVKAMRALCKQHLESEKSRPSNT